MRVFTSMRWLNSGPSDKPAAVVAAAKPSVAFSAVQQLEGLAAAWKSRQWPLLLPC